MKIERVKCIGIKSFEVEYLMRPDWVREVDAYASSTGKEAFLTLREWRDNELLIVLKDNIVARTLLLDNKDRLIELLQLDVEKEKS